MPALESLESRVLFSFALPHLTPPVPPPPLVTQLAGQTPLQANTVPGNGDVNPYGVAFVPRGGGGGKLIAGDILVSNFNNSSNAQGTGTTIVEIDPKTGDQTLFFQGATGLGLTTALGVLSNGDVIVGSVPANSQGAPANTGELLIINKRGNLVRTINDPGGPWDLTVFNVGPVSVVFVSEVLTGKVTRLDLFTPTQGFVDVLDRDSIATGYTHRSDSLAFEIGPTGLAFNPFSDTLYVASTGDNAVFSVSNALFRESGGMGKMIFTNALLRGPLGLSFTPTGDLITANGDAINTDPTGTENSELVEFTPGGQFVGQFQVDPAIGSAFGLALNVNPDGSFTFAAVDDGTNQLDIWQFAAPDPIVPPVLI